MKALKPRTLFTLGMSVAAGAAPPVAVSLFVATLALLVAGLVIWVSGMSTLSG